MKPKTTQRINQRFRLNYFGFKGTLMVQNQSTHLGQLEELHKIMGQYYTEYEILENRDGRWIKIKFENVLI